MLNNSLVGDVRGRDCRLRERPVPTACAAPTGGELPVEAEVRAAPTAPHRHGLLSRAGAARCVRHRVVHPIWPSSGQKAIGGEDCTLARPRAPDVAGGAPAPGWGGNRFCGEIAAGSPTARLGRLSPLRGARPGSSGNKPVVKIARRWKVGDLRSMVRTGVLPTRIVTRPQRGPVCATKPTRRTRRRPETSVSPLRYVIDAMPP